MSKQPDDKLVIWTIYDRPRDFPSGFLARKFVVDRNGSRPTNITMIAGDIEIMRSAFIDDGLVCLPADVGDDPSIVESWL